MILSAVIKDGEAVDVVEHDSTEEADGFAIGIRYAAETEGYGDLHAYTEDILREQWNAYGVSACAAAKGVRAIKAHREGPAPMTTEFMESTIEDHGCGGLSLWRLPSGIWMCSSPLSRRLSTTGEVPVAPGTGSTIADAIEAHLANVRTAREAK